PPRLVSGQMRGDDLPLAIGQVTGIAAGPAHILGMRGPWCSPGLHTSRNTGPAPAHVSRTAPRNTASPHHSRPSRQLSDAHLGMRLNALPVAVRQYPGTSVPAPEAAAYIGIGIDIDVHGKPGGALVTDPELGRVPEVIDTASVPTRLDVSVVGHDEALIHVDADPDPVDVISAAVHGETQASTRRYYCGVGWRG